MDTRPASGGGRGARLPGQDFARPHVPPDKKRPGSGRATFRPQTTYGRDFGRRYSGDGSIGNRTFDVSVGTKLARADDLEVRAFSVRPSRTHDDLDDGIDGDTDSGKPPLARSAWTRDDDNNGLAPRASALGRPPQSPLLGTRNKRPVSAGRYSTYGNGAATLRPASAGRERNPPPRPGDGPGPARQRRSSGYGIGGSTAAGYRSSLYSSFLSDASVDGPKTVDEALAMVDSADPGPPDPPSVDDDVSFRSRITAGAARGPPPLRKYGSYGRGAASDDGEVRTGTGRPPVPRSAGAARGRGVGRGATSDGARRASGGYSFGMSDSSLRDSSRPASSGYGRSRLGASMGGLGRGRDLDASGPDFADRSLIASDDTLRPSSSSAALGGRRPVLRDDPAATKPRYGPPPLRATHPSPAADTLPARPATMAGPRPPLRTGLGLDIGVAENANRRWRPTMEDAHVHEVSLGGDSNSAYFGVYDGHGGRDAVDYIFKKLHKDVARELMSAGNSDQAVQSAIARAFKSTDDSMADQVSQDSGATVVSALIRSGPTGKKLYVANVGDSRAVLCKEAAGHMEAVRCTKDHKGADKEEADRVRRAGGFITPARLGDVPRVNGTLAVTRALGDHALKATVINEPHMTTKLLQPEDKFVILACDGLWDVVEDRQAVDLVRGLPSAQAMADKLVDVAIKRGTTDNVTCMVIKLDS